MPAMFGSSGTDSVIFICTVQETKCSSRLRVACISVCMVLLLLIAVLQLMYSCRHSFIHSVINQSESTTVLYLHSTGNILQETPNIMCGLVWSCKRRPRIIGRGTFCPATAPKPACPGPDKAMPNENAHPTPAPYTYGPHDGEEEKKREMARSCSQLLIMCANSLGFRRP